MGAGRKYGKPLVDMPLKNYNIYNEKPHKKISDFTFVLVIVAAFRTKLQQRGNS